MIILKTQNNIFELKNVSKIFSGKSGSVKALDNIDLDIRRGEIFGIIGMSGAGKSTLVRTLNRLEDVSAGEVLFEGSALGSLSQKELRQARQQIAMIFQHFNLLSQKTVIQNVMMPMKIAKYDKKLQRSRAEEMLRIVGLEDKADAWPNQLSGGQKQRVAIARALASDPEVLLSDEATSALDPQNTRSILKLLKKLNTELGITVVVITHEMDVIKEICDDVAVMEKGKIVEYGDVFSVFASPQSPVTKNFVESTSNLSKIYELLENDDPLVRLKPGQSIVRFSYRQKTSAEALVSYISRKWDLDINIIFGNIEVVADSPIGGLVSVISGAAENIAAAMEYLRSINVGVEVIKDGGVSV